MSVLDDMAARCQDLTPAFEVIADQVVFPSIREQFYTSGHGGWAPLRPRTILDKMAGGYPLIPEIRTRRLLGSFQRGAPENIFEVNGNTATMGTTVPYAAEQQYGDPTRRLPARPFVVVTDKDISDMRAMLGNYISTGAAGQ
jgi:phage gpG-like protein